MYYLSNFSKNQFEKNPSFLQNSIQKGMKKTKDSILNIPSIKTQVSDYFKVRSADMLKEKLRKQKLSNKQKWKLGKSYLGYRKHLGDTYGKKQGMSMLKNQKNYLGNLINPSYKQVPTNNV